jgi:(p)ppGpp synthase/HD superfamily hydrolase
MLPFHNNTMVIERITKDDLVSFIENNTQIRIDSFIESAFETAEEVHAGITREDDTSSFLETHVWPVTLDVIKHYIASTQYLTTLQITSAILHDVMEDNERILDLHTSQAYGFDAYFRHRFGEYVYTVAKSLKTKPLGNFSGSNKEEQKMNRFVDYCSILTNSKYDIKIIKLADRLNNMKFISQIPKHEKIKRYLREAEDFYIAFSLFPPQTLDFYNKIRITYEDLKRLKITA